MKALVIGGGIAGLGAAFRLRERGYQVDIVEADHELGGRCRSHFWHGKWRVTGAYAFVSSETNLVEQANSIGLFDKHERLDLTANHQQKLLYKREKLVPMSALSPSSILTNPILPLGEKARLAAIFPKMLAQIGRNDPRDLTSAAKLDTESACAYFRRLSPAFVDYILEPTMQMFCGYGEDDFSIAWLFWLMAGHDWGSTWWTFKERGVGMLTHAMGEHFAADPETRVHLNATAKHLTVQDDGVHLTLERMGIVEHIDADVVVLAIPAPLIPAIMPDLDEARRSFLASVGYVGHHIVHCRFESAAQDLPDTRLLPSKDGFKTVSNLHFYADGPGVFVANAELKGEFCAATLGAADDVILDAAWQDMLAAAPNASDARFVDRHLQRNDLAICRREAGFVRRLADFRGLPSLPRISFAGDWMINSSVGQAHWSGLEAADALPTAL